MINDHYHTDLCQLTPKFDKISENFFEIINFE